MIHLIVTGGGTLGHIHPAKLIIEEILNNYKDIKIYYVGKKNSLEEKVIAEIKEVTFIPQEINGFSKSIYKSIKSLFLFMKSCKSMKKILLENNIELVIGTGGYITSSSLYQASKMNIKTVIHEQNAIMGRTNKFLAKRADLVITSLDSPYIKKKGNFMNLGNPRMDIAISSLKPISHQKKLILIVGGSLGAKYLNDEAVKLFEVYKNETDIEFILITGDRYYDDYKSYNYTYNRVKVISRSDDFLQLLSNSSMIISRAGATTISEIIALRKPSILIPSPNVSNNHQEYNAKILLNKKACKMILERDLNVSCLKENIEDLLKNPNNYQNMCENLALLSKYDVCKNIVKESFKLIKE